MKLTPRLTIIFLVYGGALLAVVGLLAYESGRAALRSATISELSATAIEKESALNEWVEGKQVGIAHIVADPAIIEIATAFTHTERSSAEGQALHDRLVEELQPHVDSGVFLAIMWIDPQTGEVIAATDPTEEGKFKEDRPFFINGRLDPFVQNVYYALAVQGPAMTAAAPLKGPDGRLLGVLAGRINLDEMNEIVNRRSGLRDSDDAFLVNSSNFFVTQPYLVEDPAVLQRGVHTEAVNRCLAQTSGTVDALDYRGVPAIIAYRWMPEQELCLIVKLDQAEAYAAARTLGFTILGISALALLIALALASALSRTITRPILGLQAGAVRIGRGALHEKLPESSPDELGDLARELNKMAASLADKDARLQEYATDLERKVEQRTAEIRRREERYRSYIEVTGQLGWTTNAQGEVDNEMASWREYTGQSEEEVQGWGWSKALHPDDVEHTTQVWQNAVARQTNYEVEYRLRRHDGEYRHFLARGVPILDEQDEVLEWVGTCIDITERQRAEEALRRFELLSANSQDIILFMRRADGRILEANAAAVNAYGYSRDELLGLTIQNLRAPDTLSLTTAQMEQADAGGILFETVHQRKDGSRFPVEVSSQGATIGSTRTLISIIRDISDRKKTEEELASLSRFPGENPNPVLRAQHDGQVVYANAVSRELMEMWGCEIGGYLPGELVKLIEAAATSGQSQTVELPCNEKIYSIMVTPIITAGYVNLYGRNITEHKRAEADLHATLNELKRSNAELEEFAYVASHDLQEPLRGIAGLVQLLQMRYRGHLDERADEYITHIVDGTQRMQSLINDLLAYSRIGRRNNPILPIDANGPLQAAVKNLSAAIKEFAAIISNESLPKVQADATQLTQVFQNLIGNAIKFRGERAPQIRIGVADAGDFWELSVRDNGIGIEPQFFERIFLVFQRLHTRREYSGTGIGLAICKKIIERHGGRIWVESEKGLGTTFYFTLPKGE